MTMSTKPPTCPMCQLVEGITQGVLAAVQAGRARGEPAIEDGIVLRALARGGISCGMAYEKNRVFTEEEKSLFCFVCKLTTGASEGEAKKLLEERSGERKLEVSS